MLDGRLASHDATIARAGFAFSGGGTLGAPDRPRHDGFRLPTTTDGDDGRTAFGASDKAHPTDQAIRSVALFFPDCWAAALRPAVVRVTRLGGAIPMPALLRRHVSKREVAFIAAAYAIPLPGTALVAALMVGVRLLYRRLRARWAERSVPLVENG